MRGDGGTDKTSVRRLLTVAGCFALALLSAPEAVAEPVLTMTLTPAEVRLTPGATTTGAIVISNEADFATRLQLSAIPSDPSLQVELPASSGALRPGASRVFTYTVTRVEEGRAQDATVTFVGTAIPPPSSARARSEQAATLTVRAAEDPALIEAKAESNFTNVNEHRPASGSVVLTNMRGSSVDVDALEINAPAGVKVTVTCPDGTDIEVAPGASLNSDGCTISIPAASQALIRVRFTADEALTPGPRQALLRFQATAPTGASDSAVATFAFSADVFAESDLLKAIGVPAFLLLPGVVILVFARFLIRHASPWKPVLKDVPQSDVITSASITAVTGLALSLMLARLYPWLTENVAPGQTRDYLSAYGFRDFYWVMLYSFVIGAAFYALSYVVFAANLARRWLVVPREGDSAADLLRKVGLRGLYSSRVNFPAITVDQRAALNLDERRQGKVLAVPGIAIDLKAGEQELRNEIDAHIKNQSAFGLWRSVRKAVKKEKAEVRFRPGDLATIRLVDAPPPTNSERPIAEVAVS